MRLSRALILNGRPGTHDLTEGLIDRVKAAIGPDAFYDEGWLDQGSAWQGLMTMEDDEDTRALSRRVRAHTRDHAIDVNIVADDLAFRRSKLLIADMESTMIEQEMIDELADHVGRRDEIAKITERAMRGELDFEASLRERVGMLAGLDGSVLDEIYARRVTLMPGAATLIKTMRANGAYCALVSGGFTVFTERVAARLGFDEQQANVLEIENGKLTGRVREPILGRAAKRQAMERIAKARGIHQAETLAVGDGANDLDMLGAAGLGVAFRAKPKVREAAHAMRNGAVITHGDLTGLLSLQGYRRNEYVD